MKKFYTKLLLSIFLFAVSYSYAQENFKDVNLQLIQKIAYNIKFENTVEFVEKMDFKLTDNKKYNFGHFFHFKDVNENMVTVYYDENNVLENVSINLPTETRDLAQNELDELKFAWTKEDNGMGSGVRWRKKAYPFNWYFSDTTEVKSSLMLYVN